MVAIFLLPQYHLYLWGLLSLGSAAAIVVGVARNRPTHPVAWLFVVAGVATFAFGDITYDVLTEFLHRSNPFPSLADVFYLATLSLPLGRHGHHGASPPATGRRDGCTVGRAHHHFRSRRAVVDLSGPAVCARGEHDAVRQADVHRLPTRRHPALVRARSPGVRRRDPTTRRCASWGRARWVCWAPIAPTAGSNCTDRGRWAAPPTSDGCCSTCAGAPRRCTRRCASSRWNRRGGRGSSGRRTLALLSVSALAAPLLIVWRDVVGVPTDAGDLAGASAVVFVLVLIRLDRAGAGPSGQCRPRAGAARLFGTSRRRH